jgi:HAMP domain-containing protein
VLLAGRILLTSLFIVSAFLYHDNGDLQWQRALGEGVIHNHALPTVLGTATFSAPDARWIPHEWLFATVWALASDHASVAVFVFRIGCAAIAGLMLALTALRSRGAAPFDRTFVLAAVAIGVLPSFGLRAQILAWPLIALLMLALERGGRAAWFAVPIAALWFNLHASALVVPVIVVLDGIGRALDSRRIANIVSPLLIAAACTFTSLATPFGFALPAFTLRWAMNPATSLIAEWQPAALKIWPILVGTLVIATLLLLGELRGAHLKWSQRLLALVLLIAACTHVRNIALFCIVAGPWAAYSMSAILSRPVIVRSESRRTHIELAGIALIASVVLVFFAARTNTEATERRSDLSQAVAQLVARHEPLRVACEDFSWCSRFSGDRAITVLIDGRTDAYPPAVFADYRLLMNGDVRPVLDRWRLDAVIAHRESALAHAMRKAGWTTLRRGEPQVFLNPVRRRRAVVSTDALGLRRVLVGKCG